MKRRLNFLALMAVMLIALTLIWANHAIDPINQANCDRIQNGMTEAEVVQILGNPDHFECTDPTIMAKKWWSGCGRNKIWVGIRAEFRDKTRLVVGKGFYSPNLWETMLDWWNGTFRPRRFIKIKA